MTKEAFPTTQDGVTSSEALNHAFTYLTKSFKAKLDSADWIERQSTRAGLVQLGQIFWDPKLKDPDALYDEYLDNPDIYRQADKRFQGHARAPLSGPVGEYGEDWAKRLLLSTVSLIKAASEDPEVNINQETEFIDKHYGEDLGDYTYRAI
jgi:hypothetical protein